MAFELCALAVIVTVLAVGIWLVGKLSGQIELLIQEVREAHKRSGDEIHRLADLAGGPDAAFVRRRCAELGQ